MQFSLSQQGIFSAIFLFSFLVVPASNIPLLLSIKLLTGSVSPFKRLIVSLKFNFLLSLYSKVLQEEDTFTSIRLASEASITLLLISIIFCPLEAKRALVFSFIIDITLFILYSFIILKIAVSIQVFILFFNPSEPATL